MEASAQEAGRTPVQGTKRLRSRSMLKCDYCRDKKCKCLPYPRDWPGVKCDACAKGGQPCGPNTHFKGAGTLSSAPSRSLATPLLGPEAPHLPSTTPNTWLALSPRITRSDGPPPTDSLQNVGSIYAHRASSSVFPDPISNSALLARQNDQAHVRENPLCATKKCLLQLGELLILLECLLHRRQAVNKLILRAQSSSAPHVITALDFVIHLTKLKYSALLETILNLVEEINEPYKELFLLRTAKAIEDFSTVVREDDASADAVDGRICTMLSSVLRKLVDIYMSQHEYPQAEQLLRQLHALSTKSADTPEYAVTADNIAAEQVAESFHLSSKKMVDVLKSFNVPAKYMKWLDCAGNDPFPSIERAMIDQSPVVARILHETGRCGLDDADILLRRALHIAAETSDLALLDLVLRRSPQLLSSRDFCQMTALCIAAYCGHTEFFRALVAAGADLTHRDEDGRSILSIATGAGHFEIVLFILSQGFSPNDDWTLHVCSPLHAAAGGGHLHVCELLLERGAYANWFSKGKTPAQVADENGHPEVATMMRNAEDRARNRFPTDKHGHAQINISEAIRAPLPEPTVHVAQTRNLSLTPVSHADLLSTEMQESNISSPLDPSWVFAEGDQ